MKKATLITLGCISIAQGIAYGQSGSAELDTNVHLPPLSVSLQSTMIPAVEAVDSWTLSYTEWRSASPDSNVEYYGHVSTSSGGWEEFEFSSWSDDPTAIDPSVDPHMETIFNNPSIWGVLSFFNVQPYTVTSMDLDISLCIDDGCIQTVPESDIYDDSNALSIMDETITTASIPSKTIRSAVFESGAAGQALIDSLRADGKTDKQIDSEYPGLLIPAVLYYITPDVTVNAYWNPVVYTVFNDDGLIVTGAEMILFFESKNMPQQMIYEIVNGLMLSPSPSLLQNGEGDTGNDDYKDIEIEVEVSGGASAQMLVGSALVKIEAAVNVKVKGTAGQLQDGGEEIANQIAETMEDAINTVMDEAEANANGTGIEVKVALATAQFLGWLGGLF